MPRLHISGLLSGDPGLLLARSEYLAGFIRIGFDSTNLTKTRACAGYLEYPLRYAGSVISKPRAEEEMAIFKKSDDTDGQDIASEPKPGKTGPSRSRNVAVIGSTLVIRGELSADEDLIIDGHIEGTIAHHKKNLTVGEKGRVKADIHASSVIVLGQLVGDIHSEGIVSLAKGSDVKGNIFCSRLFVEDGARFKGNVDMGELPRVGVPKEPLQAEPVRRKVPKTVQGHTAKSSLY